MKSCGPCTLCCTVLDIPELAKPAGRPCVHLGAGCGIYPDRPTPCRVFTCGWLATEALGEAWRPDIAGFLVRDERATGSLCIDVAPDRPGAWRAQPYLTQIKAWSRMVHDRSGCLLVFEGAEVTVVFPEEDIALGAVGPQPKLSVGYIRRGGTRRPLVRLLEGEAVIREWIGLASR
jgi:hypothetical protein